MGVEQREIDYLLAALALSRIDPGICRSAYIALEGRVNLFNLGNKKDVPPMGSKIIDQWSIKAWKMRQSTLNSVDMLFVIRKECEHTCHTEKRRLGDDTAASKTEYFILIGLSVCFAHERQRIAVLGHARELQHVNTAFSHPETSVDAFPGHHSQDGHAVLRL
ncbi:hypothetical protein BDY19DRAFT_310649 [Irpex rosettiformis]|uniref:Uncharacterized protein n=1 Tax=Irpex rosettiformis TaxID=378272 RepID=A0ACB8TZI1_9APHY|nr:hypothetical protein BDY19DRAFT_310649 [Irpex rosettiformis]